MLEGYKAVYDSIKTKMDKNAKIVKKLEDKLTLITKGYIGRKDKLATGINAAYDEIQKLKTNLVSYSLLADTEKRVLPKRLKQIQEELNEALDKESKLQLKYSKLSQIVKMKL
jgi:hypothetical protein